MKPSTAMTGSLIMSMVKYLRTPQVTLKQNDRTYKKHMVEAGALLVREFIRDNIGAGRWWYAWLLRRVRSTTGWGSGGGG